MNKTILSAAIILGMGFTDSTKESNTHLQTEKADKTVNQKTTKMKNLVSIVEIPTTDFSRAVTFYQTILGVSITEVDMGGTKMGLFPGDGEAVNVALIHGEDYKPSTDGTTVYLHAGNDLQPVLDKIEPNGGKILVPKTEISPEMGFFAMFTDTEGNRLGLHSEK